MAEAVSALSFKIQMFTAGNIDKSCSTMAEINFNEIVHLKKKNFPKNILDPKQIAYNTVETTTNTHSP